MDEHYPLEYIRGEVEFFGKKFAVSPDVLIPRLETEVLVRRARKILQQNGTFIVVDIGTGSGIIGISCADYAHESIFIDISEKALDIARKNFGTLFPNKKGEFIMSDLLEYLPDIPVGKTLFLANLPYVRTGDWSNMSYDTHYEPECALFGGSGTGFELYEKLFFQLQEKNLHGILIIEFGFDQGIIAQSLLGKFGWKYELFPDYAGIDRFAEIHF